MGDDWAPLGSPRDWRQEARETAQKEQPECMVEGGKCVPGTYGGWPERGEHYTVKDSGEREEYDSGMVRDTDSGKTKWHLVRSGPMYQRWAEHLTKGADKYDDNNWMQAEGEAELERFRASADRHFAQWWNGDTDEDHAAAVFFNINGAEYVRQRLDGGSDR